MTMWTRRLVLASIALAACGAAAGQQGVPAIVEVPYRRVKDQRLIEVHIAGQGPFTFLVDTGVSGVGVDTDVAVRVGMELDEDSAREIPRPGGGTALLYQSQVRDLAVGALEVGDLQAGVLPLSAFGDRLGEPLHGILGSGFLDARVTRFDDVAGSLSFASSADAFAADVAAADLILPMEIAEGDSMPLIEVTLGGTSFIATLDTGSSLGLELFDTHAEEFGLGHAFEEWEPSSVLGGSIGRATAYDGVVDAIEIGPLRFTDVPTSITPARPGDTSGRKGNLGNQLWRGWVLILDYPGERVIFRKK